MFINVMLICVKNCFVLNLMFVFRKKNLRVTVFNLSFMYYLTELCYHEKGNFGIAAAQQLRTARNLGQIMQKR